MQAPSPAAPPPSSTTAPAQDEFVPIDELPADEKLPAAPLLIAAYAVVWMVRPPSTCGRCGARFLRAEQDLKQLAGRLPPAR